jgi:hypothetical protein
MTAMIEEKEAKLNGLVDRMIRRLSNYGHLDGFSDEDVISVLEKSYQVMEPLPTMIEMEAPLVIFGKITNLNGYLLQVIYTDNSTICNVFSS